MSKVTTSLSDIMQSELIKDGFDEMVDKEGNLVFYDDNFSFIQKILRYEPEVEKVVTEKIFGGYSFESELVDKTIKRLFLKRFYDREINRQTLESFALQVQNVSLTYENYINEAVLNISKYILGESSSDNTGENSNESNHRALMADLPQNNINMSLQNDVLDFATTNNISKDLTKGKTKGNTKNQKYDLGQLIKSKEILNDIMNKYDKKCFLQRW